MRTVSTITMLLFVVSLSFASGTGIIQGKVLDRDTNDPLPGANLVLANTNFGAATDVNGYFKLAAPAGEYTLFVTYIGYKTDSLQHVRITANSTITKTILLEAMQIEGEEVTVSAQAVGRLPGISTKDGVVIRGLSKSMYAPTPNVMNETWMSHNTEEYSRIRDNEFMNVMHNPLSTFAADVDAASYANIRRFLMQDQLPYKDAVRSEECINYFDYDYPQPNGEHPLAVYLEASACPWNPDNNLVHIGIQGKAIDPSETVANNLVFLLDVSGSMNNPKKLPLLKKAFALLIDQLDGQDKVSIVVYASNTGLVLPPTNGNDKKKIMRALDNLQAGGSTAGGQGIQLAYKIAKENYIPDGNNRIILATDGDFNVGISSTSELTRYIEEKRDEGIFLTVLGFGMGNYKDDRLQELADRGNGNHYYIDNIMEAKKVLVNDLTATLFTIAKDVKIQVEFNPAHVESYRLIGYENRLLQDKDFEDDTKDAGEMGAGHTVTALYEMVPAKPGSENATELKYTQTSIKPDAIKDPEWLTVRIRYKQPKDSTSVEMTNTLDNITDVNKTSDNFRYAAAVAQYAALLRDSEFKGNATFANTYEMAENALDKDTFGYRHEFLGLVQRAEMLAGDAQNRLHGDNQQHE